MKVARFVGLSPCALLAVMGASGLGEARADLIVGNLTQSQDFSGSFGSLTARLAAPFSLDAGFTPSSLDSITLPLGLNPGGTDPSFVQVSLWSDSGSLPGSPLVVVAPAQLLFDTLQEFTFAASFPFTLQPATSYWIVLEKTGGAGGVRWGGTDSNALDAGSSPFAHIPPDLRAGSVDSGMTWFADNLSHRFAVNATPIPAPASVAPLAFGVFATRRRRRG